MSDDSQTASVNNQSKLKIPEDIAEKFPDITDMIKGSHSMDDEERQYWVDVLSIMSDDQVQNLRNILENEKKQIGEAKQSYYGGTKQVIKNVANTFNEDEYLKKKQVRVDAEKMHEEKEKENEKALLAELDSL